MNASQTYLRIVKRSLSEAVAIVAQGRDSGGDSAVIWVRDDEDDD
jgi:hypothetical protein